MAQNPRGEASYKVSIQVRAPRATTRQQRLDAAQHAGQVVLAHQFLEDEADPRHCPPPAARYSAAAAASAAAR